MTSTATKPLAATARSLRELALDLARGVGLEDVAFFDVGEIPEHDAAVESGCDLTHIVVEAAEARDLAVVDDRAVAHESYLRPAGDLAFGDVGAGDDADAGGPEQL